MKNYNFGLSQMSPPGDLREAGFSYTGIIQAE